MLRVHAPRGTLVGGGAMLLWVIGCGPEGPAGPEPTDGEVHFAGRYTFALVGAENPWFDGEAVISGPPDAVLFDFGEAAYGGTADGDSFVFAGDDAEAAGSVYSNSLAGTIAFDGDPAVYDFLAERVSD